MISYSAPGLTISETLLTNAIAWVHSLPDAEMGPTRRILEDLESLSRSGGFPVRIYPVGCRADLIDVLEVLAVESRKGLRPILHVDAHGNAADGILLAPSGERVGWDEIIPHLRNLNIATKNNLTCIFALCFGLHFYKEVSLNQPVPAYLFFAPPSEVSVGFLEDHTLAFYRHMNEHGNVTAAFEATLGGKLDSFHCQGLLFQAMLRYIRFHCMGKGRQKRIEFLTSAIMQRDGINNPSSAQLKEVRSQIHKVVEPGQKLIDVYAQKFLIGRTAAFTYEDIANVLNRSKIGRRSPRSA